MREKRKMKNYVLIVLFCASQISAGNIDTTKFMARYDIYIEAGAGLSTLAMTDFNRHFIDGSDTLHFGFKDHIWGGYLFYPEIGLIFSHFAAGICFFVLCSDLKSNTSDSAAFNDIFVHFFGACLSLKYRFQTKYRILGSLGIKGYYGRGGISMYRKPTSPYSDEYADARAGGFEPFVSAEKLLSKHLLPGIRIGYRFLWTDDLQDAMNHNFTYTSNYSSNTLRLDLSGVNIVASIGFLW
jgi:hypothetical protein